jgi:Co/Zn/Cd efflux system component
MVTGLPSTYYFDLLAHCECRIANAETICLGLVAVTVFFTTLPLFNAAGGVLLQMAPSGTSASALNKCLRQVRMDEDVIECCEARFWEMVPGSIVGTLLLQVILCYKVSCVCFWSNRCGLLFSG